MGNTAETVEKHRHKTKQFFEDGSTYEGQFKNGFREGDGEMLWANGDRYKGHWRMGCLDGNGMFWYADKSVYRGQFDMNQRSGYGIYTFPDGRMYEGEWGKNNPHGRGQVTMTNGTVVCAEFANGQSNRITGSSEASLMPGQIPMLKANSVPMKESIGEKKEDAMDKIRALKAIGALRTGDSPKINPFAPSPAKKQEGPPSQSQDPDQIPFKNPFDVLKKN